MQGERVWLARLVCVSVCMCLVSVSLCMYNSECPANQVATELTTITREIFSVIFDRSCASDALYIGGCRYAVELL